MKALLSRCLYKGDQPEIGEHLPQCEGNGHPFPESCRGFRIDIEEEEIGRLRVIQPCKGDIQFDRGKVGQPDEGVRGVADDIVEISPGRDRMVAIEMDPFRRPSRGILLIESRGTHPVRKPLEHERPVPKMAEDVWSDAKIILNHVKFCQVEFRIHHPRGIGEHHSPQLFPFRHPFTNQL